MRVDPRSAGRNLQRTLCWSIQKGPHETMVSALFYAFEVGGTEIKWFPEFYWTICADRQQHILIRVIHQLVYYILVGWKDALTVAAPVWHNLSIVSFLRNLPDFYDPFTACWINKGVLWRLAPIYCQRKKRACVAPIVADWLHVSEIVVGWRHKLFHIP